MTDRRQPPRGPAPADRRFGPPSGTGGRAPQSGTGGRAPQSGTGGRAPQRPAQRPVQRAPQSGTQRAPQRPAQRAPQRPAQRPVQRAAAQRPTQRPPVRRPARPPRTPRALRLGRLEGRMRYGFAAVCVLLLVIGGRLVQLQGVDHTDYAAAATEQRLTRVPLHALRGSILDRDGTALAFTANAQDVTADPAQVRTAVRGKKITYAAYLAKLQPLVGATPTALLTALTRKGEFSVLASALPPVTAQRVEDLELPGIYTQATTQRQYPARTVGANVVGTVHSDGTGAAGIESEFNSVLAGRNGSQTYTTDNLGNVNPSSRTVVAPARNGATIKLTIDQDLQYMAQQYLDVDVPKSGARGAEMAVMDAHTGQVLALASSGTFDASNPNTIDPDKPINPPVMSAFEPGSVQKAITFAAALQEKKITPMTTMTVADSIRMGGVTVRDAWYHSPQPFTATGILAQSSNVGTLQIAKQLGPETWYRYEKLFGVGDRTGIELPGESAGYVPQLKDWSASTFANLPFGQGESMTILQLASIYQAIANNGVRIPPRIVQSVTKADGSVSVTRQPAGIRVVDPDVSKTLRTMLESVTMAGGTGVKAAIPGYRIAGKTGTAQQPDPNHGGAYSSYMNWDTFAGMVPADDPQFVVAIMVDNPAHGVEGGDVAAPLFHQIASYEVQHAHVPPTGSIGKHVPLENCKGQNPAYLPANVC